jgi:hypothetical protein
VSSQRTELPMIGTRRFADRGDQGMLTKADKPFVANGLQMELGRSLAKKP